MDSTSSALGLGLALAVISGLMNGTFTLPMRYLGRWSWENVWALFILIACVLMPVVIATATVSRLGEVLRQAPVHAIAMAVICGFAWGFGAVMFGQGVSAIGISLGNTFVLAISSSLGAFLPILVLDPGKVFERQGEAIMAGTGIAIAGIAFCGYAGKLKERSQVNENIRQEMVGEARPFWIGLLLCAGAGVLSAVFNIGYSSAQGIVQSAVRLGNSAFAGSNVVWLLMLTGGAIANLGFCAYLFKKNRSWAKYAHAGSPSLYGLTLLMGLLWGGSIFVYGSAAPKLGRLGPAIGWPLSLSVGLLTANLCGIFAGEWRYSRAVERVLMGLGLLVLILAIITLGWSGTLS
ncbi:MAG TPA: L-rhamnose/proton symporter RhaT [Terriglobales bacterium]|nr:L-rhamnose/proton symporter RhaT [Terriglobales bacterium]